MEIPEPTFDMSQVLPARKQWVDLDMQQITPAIGYIKTDMNGIQSGEADLQLSDKDKTKFDSELTDCAASIDRALAYTTQLQQLTVGPTYDNLAIAKLTSQMHKELGTVEKSTKRLIGEIKKSKTK